MKSLAKFMAEAETKSSCEELFQKYVFGQKRGKGENDTKEEREIFLSLVDWVHAGFNNPAGGTYRKPKTRYWKGFMRMKECKKYYQEILAPPKKKLYRGTTIPRKNFQTMAWKKKGKYYVSGNYTYKSSSNITSWTVDLDSAEFFADGATRNLASDNMEGVDVILSIPKPTEEFILKPKFLKKLAFGEGEVVRVGGKPIKCSIMVSEDVIASIQFRDRLFKDFGKT